MPFDMSPVGHAFYSGTPQGALRKNVPCTYISRRCAETRTRAPQNRTPWPSPRRTSIGWNRTALHGLEPPAWRLFCLVSGIRF